MSTALLIISCILLFCFLVTGFLCLQSRKELARYKDISDAEQYLLECQTSASEFITSKDIAAKELFNCNEELKKQKNLISKYQQTVRAFKTAAELKQHIAKLSKYAEGCKSIRDLENKIEHQTSLASQLTDDIKQLGFSLESVKDVGLVAKKVAEKEQALNDLRKSILQIEEVKELQEFGFYQRKYEFDTSEAYKKRLDKARAEQKLMIKEKTAATCDAEWVVEGSKSKGKKMTNDQIKILLRAFNGESDAAITKVNFSNATTMESRINRSFDQINKMGSVNQVEISRTYLKLKLEELYLAHEHKIQKQEEKEEQKRIREEMQEELKAEREIEKAKDKAEKEENDKELALEKAREELLATQGKHTEKLSELVAKLENELKDAIDRKAKAIARAQLTKSGHVYILSNIGSFGEGVYKIGMTRRLEPLDRVKELGDASVPFLFDVHAMIYSENAPELEKILHRHFESRRVNVINTRKEFFRVGLEEIADAVSENFGEITYIIEPEAAEFRQTVAHLAEIEDEVSNRQLETLAAS